MANGLGLVFPFSVTNNKGYVLDLNNSSNQKIKSDLFFFLTTPLGSRYRNPNFGCNFLKFIYEPSDDITEFGIKQEINEQVKLWFPNVTIDSITINQDEQDMNLSMVKIVFTIINDIFTTTDYILMQL